MSGAPAGPDARDPRMLDGWVRNGDLLAGDNVYGSTPALTEAWLMAYAKQARAGR